MSVDRAPPRLELHPQPEGERLSLAQKEIAWKGQVLNLRAFDQMNPAFLAPNPAAMVPVLVDEGLVLTESRPAVVAWYVRIAARESIRITFAFETAPPLAAESGLR